MVTVGLGSNARPRLYTAQGIALGEEIYVADLSDVANYPPTNLETQLTAVPTTPALGDGGAAQYIVSAGSCSSSGTTSLPIDVSLTSSSDQDPCIGLYPSGSSFDVAFPLLVEADDSAGNPLGYAYSHGNAPVLDGGSATVALASPWQTTMFTQTLLPTTASDGGGAPTSVSYSEVADGVLTPLTQHASVGVGPSGPTFYTHPGFATTEQVEAQLATANSATAVVSALAPSTASNDLLTDVNPLSTAPTFASASANWAAAQPVFSWTLGRGSLATSTSVTFVAEWYSVLDGGGNQTGIWTIVAPGTSATSLTAPVLPATFAAYAPSQAASSQGNTAIAVSGAASTLPYPLFLTMASLFQADADLCGIPSPLFPALPGLAALVMSIFTDEGGC
jgi:hypothetical protein